jgi:hypothetical protein
MDWLERFGRSERDVAALRRNIAIALLRRSATHDRLGPTLAKRFSRGFQEAAIFFKLVHALSATLRRSRARDACVRMQRTPARSPTLWKACKRADRLHAFVQ